MRSIFSQPDRGQRGADRTKAAGAQQPSHRVIVDHLRSTSFLVADGVLPANEGRGYVLRRIMRRAMRHAHLLGASEPLMHRLVPSLVAEMGAAYPELVRAQPLIEATLKQEETRFRQTLDKGLRLLDEATGAMKPGDTLAGETAFKLYDTYGFSLRPHRGRARAQGFASTAPASTPPWPSRSARPAPPGRARAPRHRTTSGSTSPRKRAAPSSSATRRVGEGPWWRSFGMARASIGKAGRGRLILTNQTPFYASPAVRSATPARSAMTVACGRSLATRPSSSVAFTSTMPGSRKARSRSATRSSCISTAPPLRHPRQPFGTHLLHAALRERLGKHVAQKGSLVAPDRLRFDVSHPNAMAPAELAKVEEDVNAQVRANTPVSTRLMTPDEAIAEGAMALFGENMATRSVSSRWERTAADIRSSCVAAPTSRRWATSACSR
jgi:alanyl-tRNA synthetase